MPLPLPLPVPMWKTAQVQPPAVMPPGGCEHVLDFDDWQQV